MKTNLTRNMLFAVLLPLMALQTVSAAGESERPPMPVEAQVVKTEDLVRSLEVVGSLSANENVTISPEVSGRISEILFREGQMVTAGTTLFRLDDSIQRAELKQAEASRGLSEVEYKRAKQLVKTNAGSVNTRDSALAKLRIDQAGVALAKERVAKMTLQAPFKGLVGLRDVSVGDYVTPGQSLVDLVVIDPMRVEFRVPEVYLSGLAEGQAVQVTLDSMPGETFSGTVFAISPQVDINGRSVKVVASLPNKDGRLRPGLFARVSLSLETIENALMLQEEALVPKGDQQLVYLLQDGKVSIRPVITGLRERGRVQVLEGVQAGDIVVTAGQMKLQPGAAANPVNLPPASSTSNSDQ